MRILIGLGGNLGDPPAAFRRALDALAAGHVLVATSRLYRTAPIGPQQPRYWNMAALLSVGVAPPALLAACHRIEAAAGRDREREARWGPRPLDLDLLLADGVVCRGPGLELPHPRLAGRAFALVPAAELAPDWIHPWTGRTLEALAAAALTADPDAVELVGSLPA